jgi:hypothetical protein
LLQLTNKLNSTQSNLQEITDSSVLNNPSAFKTQFEQLLQGIDTSGMTPAQMEQLRTDLGTDFSSLLNLSFGTMLIPRLDDLNLQTQAPAIRTAVEQGLCNSLNGSSSCSAVPGQPHVNNGLQGMHNANQSRMDAILAGMGAADLLQGQSILGVVRDTNQAVRHTSYGLEAVGNFASKAWKATHADKIMNAVTTAMVIHNGMMLSNNLLATVSEATNMALDALGIRDSDDTEIDIGAAVRAKIAAILTSILGAEQYKALTTRIAAANRVYQASANVYNLVREIGETSRSITEVACENTGKIGNALLESGVVFEDAYEQMLDSVNPQSKAQLKLEKFRNGVEVLENASEAISSISSDVIELQELKTEVTEGKEQLDTAREEFKTAMETKKEEIKTESKAETDVKKADFGKNETEE